MNRLGENILRFVCMLLLQILLLNQIQYVGWCIPYLYIFCLISLPAKDARWADLLIGFGTGLLIDIASNSLGIHAAACTLLCFMRYYAIKWFVSNDDRIQDTPSSIAFMSFAGYVKYVVLLVVVHHATVFSLEAFSFAHWWWVLLQIIVSSSVTIGCILLYDLLKYRR